MARSNDLAAQMLQEFADLLAISGGDAFKVRAYEKAARAVAGHPVEVVGLDEKGLTAIPGIGAHLARKIIEFREAGSCHELDELRARVPASLRTLLVVPGLGPKRARQVYGELGICSVGGRGIDGPIRAAVDVVVEPVGNSHPRLIISVDFAGQGIGKILVP